MKNRLISAALIGTSGIAMLATMPTITAYAQDQEVREVDEIIVTARRRAESLKDVPGTVTALTETTLTRAGVARAADFIEMTPGVTMVDAAEVGDTQVNIRGINGARDAENSFAFIVDGVLYTNPAAFNREFTGLKQIEVFKGPQGALYGRNAAAGAIIVTTGMPEEGVEKNFTMSYGGDDTMLLKGSVAGQMSDNAWGSIAFDWRKSDGFYRNSWDGGSATIDRYEGYNVNARYKVQASDRLMIDTKLRYGEVDAGSIVFNSTFNLPIYAEATDTPSAYQNVNDYDVLFQANVPSDNDQTALEFSMKFDYEMDNMDLTGWVLYSDIDNNLMSDGTSAAFGFYAPDPVCQATTLQQNAAGTQLLPPQFIGTSPVGILFTPDFSGSFLGAYTPTTCDGIQEQLRNQSDLSMELRLSSNNDSNLQWMIGGYYLDINRQVGVSLNRDGGGPVKRGLYQAEGENATAALIWDDFDSRVLAVFGSLQYAMDEKTELSFALRYDNEQRSVNSLVPFDATQSVIDLDFDTVFNDPLNPALSPLINPTGRIPSKTKTYSELQPKVSFTYDASDNTTLFANWGVGFKAGGFNNSGSAATVDIFINGLINNGFLGTTFADDMGVPLPVIKDEFDEETSSAFELGFKTSLMDGKLDLNGAYYNTTVDDMQFFEFFVGGFGLLRVVSNIDEVKLEGAEFGATAHITDNVRLFGGYSFTDSKIKANSSRPDTVGNKSPYTPDYTLNFGMDFDTEMSDGMSFFGRLDGQVVGPTWFHTVQAGNRPTIFQPLFEISVFGAASAPFGIAEYSVAKRDAYTTMDARIGIESDKGWTISAWVKNLTNERYMEEIIPAPEFGGTFDHPGAGRRAGVEFGYKF